MDLLEKVSDANSLIEAFNRSKRGSDWKESVQKYEMNLLSNVYETQTAIRNGTYEQRNFVEFELNERGKSRQIKSIHISDRVVQRSLCDNALVPYLEKYLIYDNGASMKHKGIGFARERIETHLHKFYRKYGNDGYVLLIDFSKFFDNIPHEKLVKAIGEKIKDDRLMDFVRQAIGTFKVDVSYMDGDEYKHCMDMLFNSLAYSKIDKALLTGGKFMPKSVGIGAQISQISGVFYPTAIDTYCKIVKGIKYYARYMDDIYIIHQDKQFLKDILEDIKKISEEYGLFINTKKTQIIKLSHGFTFLKVKYILTDSGHLIKKLLPKAFTRERRKLKKYAKRLEEGKMPYKDIENAYKSWRGNVDKFHNARSLANMDRLYNELFIKPFIEGGQRDGDINSRGRNCRIKSGDSEQTG